MDELTIVANVAIVFGVIYKLFELIEKLPAEALADGKLKNGYLSSLFNCMGGGLVSSVSLRFGCLLVGLGLGLLIGYCIVVETQPGYFMENVGYAIREMI